MKSDQPDLFILKELIKLEETLTYINNRVVDKYAIEKCEESVKKKLRKMSIPKQKFVIFLT